MAEGPRPRVAELPAPQGADADLNLHTVCEEARCPNIGECWNHGTATFMILGDVCTRACSYCAVAHGRPGAVDAAEPERVAHAIRTLGLNYVVITSVDRDDLADGGASIFAETIRQTRARGRECRIEVLIPDFQGNEAALRTVLDAGPDVLNHNTETVPRLYRMARSGGRYARTLELLDRSRRYAPHIPTKTGVMVGLGESHDELVATFTDLRRVGCGILTIGQYLRPSPSTPRWSATTIRTSSAHSNRSRSSWGSSTSNPARWSAAPTTPTRPPTPTRRPPGPDVDHRHKCTPRWSLRHICHRPIVSRNLPTLRTRCGQRQDCHYFRLNAQY